MCFTVLCAGRNEGRGKASLLYLKEMRKWTDTVTAAVTSRLPFIRFSDLEMHYGNAWPGI